MFGILNKKDPANINLKRELKYWRNQVTYWKKKKKTEYFARRFEETSNDNKKSWICINEVLQNGKRIKPKNKILNENSTTEEKIKTLNYINKYFAEIGKNMTDKYKPIISLILPYETVPFKFTLLTDNDIAIAIDQLNNTSAIGYDNIPTDTIKRNVDFLKFEIKEIINTSMIIGNINDDIKVIIDP